MEDYSKMLVEARKSLPEVVFIKERFEILKVVGHVQGNRTIISNFLQIASNLRMEVSHLLKYVLNGEDLRNVQEAIIVTDRIPIQRKRDAIEKTVKKTLMANLPKNVPYRILHHESKSNLDLQIVDYCNWAVYRKWDRQDLRSYQKICSALRSEFEIFRGGMKHYY